MADKVDAEVRSRTMRAVKSVDTAPEMRVRKALWNAGIRYRLHRKDLPGRPDVVIGKTRTAIFIHGCFWHRHEGCRRATTPATRTDYWEAKFARNVERDERVRAALEEAGWRIVTIWECQTKDSIGIVEAVRTKENG